MAIGRGLRTVLGVVLLLLLLAGVDLLAHRHAARWDLTQEKAYSVSDYSRTVLERLTEPIRVSVVYDPTGLVEQGHRQDEVLHAHQRLQDLLDAMQEVTPNLAVRIVNPHSPEPGESALLARRDLRPGDILVESPAAESRLSLPDLFKRDPSTKRIVFSGENALSQSFLLHIEGKRRVIYVATGHGERSASGTGEQALQRLSGALEGRGAYDVRDLPIEQVPEIPSDCEALLIVGPRIDVSEDAVDKLSQYLFQGGRVLVMVEPVPGTDSFPNLLDLLDTWNVVPGREFVADEEHSIRSRYYPFAPQSGAWEPHPITRAMNREERLTFRTASTVSVIPGLPPETQVRPLVRSYPTALSAQQPQVETGHSMAVAVERLLPAPEGSGRTYYRTRMVVVGDADLADDSWPEEHPNQKFLFATIDWLTRDSDEVRVPPAESRVRPIELTDSELSRIFWISVFLLPGLGLALGGLTWWFRRR